MVQEQCQELECAGHLRGSSTLLSFMYMISFDLLPIILQRSKWGLGEDN